MTGKRSKRGGKVTDAEEKKIGAQLPLYAKMPKHHSNYPGLFIQSAERVAIKQRGALMPGKEGTVTSTGFTTRLDLPVPEPLQTTEKGEKYTVTDAMIIATGPHLLGANELRVYQAVLGLALQEAATNGPRADLTPATATSERAIGLRSRMGYAGKRTISPILAKHYPEIFTPLAEPCIVTLRTSLDRIAEAAGMAQCKSSRMAVVAGFRALSAVTMSAVFRVVDPSGRVIVEESSIDMRIMLYRMISATSEDAKVGDAADGRFRNRIEISFDPHVTAVLASAPQSRYSLVPLEDMRELKGDVALLLHNRFCGMIRPGKSLRIGMNKLVGYVYHSPSMNRAADPDQVRKWRMNIRKGIEDLRRVGWLILRLRPASTNTEELFLVERPNKSTGGSTELTFGQFAALASKMSDVDLPIDAPSLDPGDDPEGMQ